MVVLVVNTYLLSNGRAPSSSCTCKAASSLQNCCLVVVESIISSTFLYPGTFEKS
jgi:hypothetical protein